jgi:hypothetical protein
VNDYTGTDRDDESSYQLVSKAVVKWPRDEFISTRLNFAIRDGILTTTMLCV